MLKNLYQKLHIIFTISIMLIITVVIGILSANDIRMESINDSTLFQRMTTLMIYQLEDSTQNIENVIRSYEDHYSMFCFAEDSEGKTVYQSTPSFPTDTKTLLEDFNHQMTKRQTQYIDNRSMSEQDGIIEIGGTSNDKYWGISAKVISKNNHTYHLMLLYKQKSVLQILQKQLPFYFVLWFVALLSVIFVSRLLLKKALKPTEQVLKSQKEFIASASHELKSPLAVLLATVEQLEKQTDNQELKRSINAIDFECMRMSRLVKDMLLLASSDAKTWTLYKSKINVDSLLITLYEAYEPICIRKKISLKLDISENSYPALYTDQERLAQILNIYMDNAIQHSTGNKNLEIRTEVTAKDITFLVTDHGKGVSKKDKPFIFDRFYCADKSRTDKSNFGLGLSIADELAKILNGKAGFKDTPGGGATFYVTLPFK
ncbi:MAG: HAMP domain-containing histidine kinase [Lachnospiraceae bacterium]|nr:HAMP domain-containing histidine kinase [Lachnospiraceae bacterium]